MKDVFALTSCLLLKQPVEEICWGLEEGKREKER
jgi:hypothetical protein